MRRCVWLSVLCTLMVPNLARAVEPPAPTPAAAGPVAAETGERFLEPLADGLARALASDGFRQSLYEELEASPYVEGRVALKRLLTEDPELREELLWHAGLTAGWDRIAAALPELELYFPMKAHRATWAGDAAIQVALPVGDSGRYRVFSPEGGRGSFTGASLPAAPTLLLAPSEIDFDDLESALEGGKRTGSYLRRQIPTDPAGTGDAPPAGLATKGSIGVKSSGVDTSRHSYLTAFTIYEDHDPYRGSMEIEIFGSIDGSYKQCQRFTGVEEYVTYFLPAAGATGSKKIAYAVPTGTNTLDLLVYEDDDTGCVIKSGDDFIRSSGRTIDSYGITSFDNLRIETLATTCGDSLCEGDESRWNCCGDCATCGDGTCNSCENGSSCPSDCYVCGNGICERSKGENEKNCSADCDGCGNGLCEPGEDYFSCPLDCCDDGSRICPQ